MTPQELVDYVRSAVLRDTARPYLWSDELLYIYLNEGIGKFCKETHYSTVTTDYDITTEAGVAEYELSEDVLWVASARVSTMSNEMRNYTHREIPSYLTSLQAMPEIYVMNEGTNLLRLYPTPDAAYTINVRASILPPDIADGSTIPLRRDYHLDIADWIVFRCLTNNDPEGLRADQAKVHEARWGQNLSDAKRDVYRLRMGNRPTARRNWTGKR